jgi:hypothetical protein
MATCNHCGYKNAVDKEYCPSCGKKVEDNTIAYILIIVFILIFVALILGPAFLVFKAYKTRQESKTNWWLIGGLVASIIAIILAPYFSGEHPDWQWLKTTAVYANTTVLIISIVLLFLRLKELEYQFIKLFKTKNNKND